MKSRDVPMTPPFINAPDAINADQALVIPGPRISIVVPCHNEADSLDRLAMEMARLRDALATRYEMELILVDDGSTDATWPLFQDRFGSSTNIQLVRHSINKGIAAAIQTGILFA